MRSYDPSATSSGVKSARTGRIFAAVPPMSATTPGSMTSRLTRLEFERINLFDVTEPREVGGQPAGARTEVEHATLCSGDERTPGNELEGVEKVPLRRERADLFRGIAPYRCVLGVEACDGAFPTARLIVRLHRNPVVHHRPPSSVNL